MGTALLLLLMGAWLAVGLALGRGSVTPSAPHEGLDIFDPMPSVGFDEPISASNPPEDFHDRG